MEKEALRRFFILRMYKTKKYGVVSCKEENVILAVLERDFERKKRKKNELTRRNQDTKSDNR